MSGMSIDDFLTHSTSSGGSSYLGNWKKRKPPQVDVFLSRHQSIHSLWRHNWLRVVNRERDGDKYQNIWSTNFNCWEGEEVLKMQYRRDRRSGRRKEPPKVCPFCLLQEEIRRLVDDGKLDWLAPVFVFEAEDDEEDTILCAAPFYNGVPRDLGKEEKKELRKAGLQRGDLWKQNCMPKCSYVFTVVDNENPGDGLQVAIETSLVGDKTKGVIRDEITKFGSEKGNPLITPYAIRWTHHPEKDQFNEKYHAVALPQLEVTDAIADLIDSDPPDISKTIRKGDVSILRSVMEARMVPEVRKLIDFDRIFAAAERLQEDAEKIDAPEDGTPTEARPSAKSEEKPKRRRRSKKKEEPKGPVPYEGDDAAPCDECGFSMHPKALVCPSCGAEYEDDGEDEESVETAPEPASDEKKGDAAKALDGYDPDAADFDDDDIPF